MSQVPSGLGWCVVHVDTGHGHDRCLDRVLGLLGVCGVVFGELGVGLVMLWVVFGCEVAGCVRCVCVLLVDLVASN